MAGLPGIDVSAWQGNIRWDEVAKGGIRFAFIKATEGVNGSDVQFKANHDGAKAAGIPFGAYHFMRFGQDPIAQAEHFLSVTNGLGGDLLPVVDVEGGGQDHVSDPATLAKSLAAFNARVEQSLHGKKILIYTDYGDWNGMMAGTSAFSGHPLWIAEYNHDKSPTLPSGWNHWSVWQHTSGASVRGITGFCDHNVLNGTDLSILSR